MITLFCRLLSHTNNYLQFYLTKSPTHVQTDKRQTYNNIQEHCTSERHKQRQTKRQKKQRQDLISARNKVIELYPFTSSIEKSHLRTIEGGDETQNKLMRNREEKY